MPNPELLAQLQNRVKRNFGSLLESLLKASADHGVFGMNILEALYRQFPSTSCRNCGTCCNAISLYSLEYHYLMRELMSRFPPDALKTVLRRALSVESRLAEVAGEKRVRCAFRDEEARVCLLHSVRPFACRMFGMKHDDGTSDCEQVVILSPGSGASWSEYEKLQQKVAENSEAWEVFPGKPEISFFPFDFWMFRYMLGAREALRIYREILIPSSTPLTRFWQDQAVVLPQKDSSRGDVP